MTKETYLRGKYTPNYFGSNTASRYSSKYYEDFYEGCYCGYGGTQAGASQGSRGSLFPDSPPFKPDVTKTYNLVDNYLNEEEEEAARPAEEACRFGEDIIGPDPSNNWKEDSIMYSHDLYWREYKRKSKTSYLTIYTLSSGDLEILKNIKVKDVISFSTTQEYRLTDITFYGEKKSVMSPHVLFHIKNIHDNNEIHSLYQTEFFQFLKEQRVPDTRNRDLGSEWNNC